MKNHKFIVNIDKIVKMSRKVSNNNKTKIHNI